MSMVITQFDLLNSLVTNLYKFEITPTAKLVLVYLTRCFNSDNEFVYPKITTIAKFLGISESSVKRSIKEIESLKIVFKEGKKQNRYKHTNEFFKQLNLTSDKAQIEPFKSVNLNPILFRTKNSEQIKNTPLNNHKTIEQTNTLIQSYLAIKPSSPLDFNKEQAIEYLSKLPKELLSTSLNQKLIKKHNLLSADIVGKT